MNISFILFTALALVILTVNPGAVPPEGELLPRLFCRPVEEQPFVAIIAFSNPLKIAGLAQGLTDELRERFGKGCRYQLSDARDIDESVWMIREGDSVVTPEDAFQIGRAVGASYAVIGNVNEIKVDIFNVNLVLSL